VIRSITAIEAPRAGQPAAGQLTRRKSGHLNLARSGHYNLAATNRKIDKNNYVKCDTCFLEASVASDENGAYISMGW
ncbi:hypothetical protein, partial [Paraburkholderia youngii]|uniref:hypothetical protein n=1 Tax=Paraburkholderia youngii TaxID=2782701 RepID=UPI001C3E39A2